MSEQVIIPVLSAVLAGTIATVLNIWFSRDKNEAETADTQSSTLERYWTRIRQLEDENESLRGKFDRLRATHEAESQEWRNERQQLWAEIGQLRSEMARLKQNGGLA